MDQSQKEAFGMESNDIINAAQTAYQVEQIMGGFSNNSDVCFDLEWLKTNNYYSKGSEEGYSGSLLIDYNQGSYTYSLWLTNKSYTFKGVDKSQLNIELPTTYNRFTDTDDIMKTCGGATNVVKCMDGARCTQ